MRFEGEWMRPASPTNSASAALEALACLCWWWPLGCSFERCMLRHSSATWLPLVSHYKAAKYRGRTRAKEVTRRVEHM